MPTTPPNRVRCAELVRDGMIITFTDGRSALFSADFLYESLSEAQEISLEEDDDSEA